MSTAPQQNANPEPPVFEDAELESLRAAFSDGQFEELVGSLVRDCTTRFERFQREGATMPLKTIFSDAHDIKSMTGNFGLLELSGLAKPIEKAAREGDEAARLALPAFAALGLTQMRAVANRYAITLPTEAA